MTSVRKSNAANLGRDESQFQVFVLENFDLAESMMNGYRFIRVRSMIEEVGAMEAAKRLLDPRNVGRPYDGFNLLAKCGLLHLSLEQAVVVWRDSGLFHASLVAAAEARLAIASRPRRLNS